jgi:hypothetical protein
MHIYPGETLGLMRRISHGRMCPDDVSGLVLIRNSRCGSCTQTPHKAHQGGLG